MFAGFAVADADQAFREKYLHTLEATSGDENIIIADISPSVGWGAFSACDLGTGDFVVRYGGMFQKSSMCPIHL